MQVAQVTTTDFVIVTAGTLLQCVIPIVCVRRKLYHNMPWFFAYNLYSVFQTIVDMSLARNGELQLKCTSIHFTCCKHLFRVGVWRHL